MLAASSRSFWYFGQNDTAGANLLHRYPESSWWKKRLITKNYWACLCALKTGNLACELFFSFWAKAKWLSTPGRFWQRLVGCPLGMIT